MRRGDRGISRAQEWIYIALLRMGIKAIPGVIQCSLFMLMMAANSARYWGQFLVFLELLKN